MSQFARQACKQYNEVCSSLLWFRLKDILLNPRVSFSISSLFFIFHPGVLYVPLSYFFTTPHAAGGYLNL
jgi:hypothetical protein